MRKTLLLAVTLLSAALAENFLIVPGRGFGPFGATMSLAQMEKKLPPGQFMTGDRSASLYALEPERRIQVTLSAQGKIRSMSVHGTQGAWHTAQGIGLGTSLAQLERINGRPFKFRTLDMAEDAGRIVDWQGGKLARPFARVRLTFASAMHAKGNASLSDEEHLLVEKEGQVASSAELWARKLNPVVETLELLF